MFVSTTERLLIQHFDLNDSSYVLRQLNDESFIRFIVDKQVRSIGDAENYLVHGPIASYEKHGFGLNIVRLKTSKIAIGMCGLVKRDELEYPDIGYAFLPEYWHKGYAYEASVGVLSAAKTLKHSETVLGVTLPNNLASNQLLTRLGFELTGEIELYNHINNFYRLKLA